ncbi:vanin-like protein 2 [Tribolium madens]|uniref:vanin-like protein 2 n=1 Tax=Tribolium madens TaxID=41895 RepID=UPI001CF75C46|nr:vanin-like protein 2 [Tribolium madens]
MRFLALCLSVLAFSKASKWENVTIAVVEYQPVANISTNTKHYIEILRNITQNLDLIVFPEDTLRSNRETAVEFQLSQTPCDSDTFPQFFHDLSCAARVSHTYLALNLVEKVKCNTSAPNPSENCKKFGFYYYNTDVVFDRNGSIISRYHKYNLFGEYDRDKPETPEEIITETDFGLKLGIFTCFDILFKAPAQELLKHGIDAVIYPTMWFSELPFLTAMQAQQMWSHGHNITLLAAGANSPLEGSGGSGVYRGGKGLVVGGVVAEGGTQTFVYQNDKKQASDVDELGRKMDGFYLQTDESVLDYMSSAFDPHVQSSNTTICYKEVFCCMFQIKSTLGEVKPNLDFYTYHLVAYSGFRSYSGVRNATIEVCGIIACLNSSLSSCGQRFAHYDQIQWPVTFEKITITAKFENNENHTQFPNSLLSSIRPIDTSETAWSGSEVTENGKNLIERKFSITKPQNRLLTFAIWGRNFEDHDDDKNSSGVLSPVWASLCASLFVIYKLK